MTTQALQSAAADSGREAPPFPPAVVEELLKLLVKGMRAHQLYLHNNPIYLRAIEMLGDGLGAVWQHTDEIALSFTEGEIRWSDRAVLSETSKSADSLPWLFFKDGIREVRILRGFEDEELAKL